MTRIGVALIMTSGLSLAGWNLFLQWAVARGIHVPTEMIQGAGYEYVIVGSFLLGVTGISLAAVGLHTSSIRIAMQSRVLQQSVSVSTTKIQDDSAVGRE